MGFLKTLWEAQPYKVAEREEKVLKTGTLPISPVAIPTKFFSFIKAITPKIIKTHPITSAIAGLIGYGVVKESPTAKIFVKETIKKVPKIPAKAIELGTGIGKVIEKEKVFGKEDVGKAVKTVGVVGGLAVAGAIIIPKVIEKIKDKKEKPYLPADVSIPPEKQLVTEKPIGIQGEVPITPEVTTITTGKKPYKRRRATKQPSVRQYVRVNVINRATSTGLRQTHKYLNQRLLN